MCKRYVAPFLVLVFLSLLFAPDFHAAATGQIKGTITDAETGEPVVNASVLVVGTNFGAVTDFEGKFTIPRLEPGTYTVRISSVDYNTVEVTEVVISARPNDRGFTTAYQKSRRYRQNHQSLSADRMLLTVFSVENKAAITSETIKHKPVQTVDALLGQVAQSSNDPNR